MKAIVMAGGTGTRLWPLSRGKYPKQFIYLEGFEHSLFQMTIRRCLSFCSPEDIYVVTNKDFEFIVNNQIIGMGLDAQRVTTLLEPQMKNTLPAIYNAVKHIRKSGDDTAVVMPSDHMIRDAEGFAQVVHSGMALADRYIFTFGIKPGYPETGFGYIKPGAPLEDCPGYAVDAFREKPDLATAERYVEAGYFWNGGIFMFDTALFDEEVRLHAPGVYQAFSGHDTAECFAATPNISIDYGVMEKSARVAVLPMLVEWDDLGSFATFYKTYADRMDADGNVFMSDEIAVGATGNLVYSEHGKVTALIGAENLVVIDQPDALLICDRDKTQGVRDVVDMLKKRNDARKDSHVTEYTPWGSATMLEDGQSFKIRRLSVISGKDMGMRMHYHRSDHLIVVSGIATVTLEGEEMIVRSGESVFVNSGCAYKLANPGRLRLEVIEVQSGQYLGDDDVTFVAD